MTVETLELNREVALPAARLWTRDEYLRLADEGWFVDERVQLLDGEIGKMPPQMSPHTASIHLTVKSLENAFGPAYYVRNQVPLDLGEFSQPEPDVAVVGGGIRDFARSQPKSALLVVEVADATLRLDRTRKRTIYARAGIPEYWIVNLIDRQLEVHRTPSEGSFAERFVVAADGFVAPLALPGVEVAVADLLP